MKHLLPIFILSLLLSSCDKDNVNEMQLMDVATAVIMPKADLRASISVMNDRDTTSIDDPGKFYYYKDYIFINDRGKGIHILDNRNPQQPVKKAFLNIPGNYDMEVKDQILYADSGTDLVVFDLSSLFEVKFLKTYENLLGSNNYQWPSYSQNVDYVEVDDYNPQTDVIINWKYTKEMRPVQSQWNEGAVNMDGNFANASGAGQGGSFARFKIVGDRLYVVDQNNLTVVDISSGLDPVFTAQKSVGWNIETIFNQGDYLYLGSTNGLHIYDISQIDAPVPVSSIQHVMGCDPVVVDGDYAYVTVRGGNACGQDLSFLEVIDISDKAKPVSLDTYDMKEPYGLGVRGNQLFVSDGPHGLRIYDKSNPTKLKLNKTMSDLNIYDVILLSEKLLMIGDGTLYQYNYTETGINKISSFVLK